MSKCRAISLSPGIFQKLGCSLRSVAIGWAICATILEWYKLFRNEDPTSPRWFAGTTGR